MRTKITLYGEIAGTIWMPAAECSKEFHLELVRIPRTSTTRTYPSIAPRSMEITRSARCPTAHHQMTVTSSLAPSIGQGWRSRITSGTKARGTRTVKVRNSRLGSTRTG
jgi:hypothetical protein